MRQIAVATIVESEDEPATIAARTIAELAAKALDRIEAVDDVGTLHGVGLQ
jgi:hypothetical protein